MGSAILKADYHYPYVFLVCGGNKLVMENLEKLNPNKEYIPNCLDTGMNESTTINALSIKS